MRKLTLIALAATATLAACGPYGGNPPVTQVNAKNPSVSYRYGSDSDLNTARSNAVAFCSQYGGTPLAPVTASNNDGSRTATFECGRTAPVAAAPSTTTVITPAPAVPVAPIAVPMAPANMTYTYISEPELADATNKANAYCTSYGSRAINSGIITNSNGSKTVTFQCVR
jgi:hypothetical protein